VKCRQVDFVLQGAGTISFSRKIDKEFPRDTEEEWDDWERRVWRERAHQDEQGNIVIPQTALHKALAATCVYLALKWKNQGYKKFFQAGLMFTQPLRVNAHRDDLRPFWLSVSATGDKSGSGGRVVDRCYPELREWEASGTCVVTEPKVTEDIFEMVLRKCGLFNGLGRWRPANGGQNGRWVVKSIQWTEVDL